MKKLLLTLALAITACLSYAQTPYLVKAGIALGGNMVLINNTLYFSANDGVNGYELWKSDGTAAGTVMVKDIRTGSLGSTPNYLTNVNGTLYFSAYDATNGNELWKSDGTADGTVVVKDIYPGDYGDSNPHNLTNVNGTLYFVADNGTNGRELWKSDGTTAGTVMVKEINPGSGGANPNYLTALNGTLYFMANEDVNGQELWKSDGTADGTVVVKDIPGSGSFYPTNLININGMLYFSANNGTNGRELWKSDGTTAGTALVKDINPGGGGSNIQYLTNINGTLYFWANNGTHGEELWKSDGTEAGTVMVKDIRSGSNGSLPAIFTNVNGTVFFVANNGTNGAELWKSDGAEAGTVMVKDIWPGSLGYPTYSPNSSSPAKLTNVNGTLYFSAAEGTNGVELWKSDGTANGTVMVKDIRSGINSSYPNYLTNVNGILYFSANDGTGNGFWALNTDTNPLPVNLLNFTATAKNNGAVLTWQTATESNNSHFEVYRAERPETKDQSIGLSFVKIGEVQASNISHLTSHIYNFTDKTPANSINYYKLEQVDNDGKTTNLGIRSLVFSLSALDLKLYPNPVTNKLHISNARAGAVYSIYNNVGKKVADGTITGNVNEINVSALPQGIYVLSVDGKTMKFVKE